MPAHQKFYFDLPRNSVTENSIQPGFYRIFCRNQERMDSLGGGKTWNLTGPEIISLFGRKQQYKKKKKRAGIKDTASLASEDCNGCQPEIYTPNPESQRIIRSAKEASRRSSAQTSWVTVSDIIQGSSFTRSTRLSGSNSTSSSSHPIIIIIIYSRAITAADVGYVISNGRARK